MDTWDLSPIRRDIRSTVQQVRDQVATFKETELSPENIKELLSLRNAIAKDLAEVNAYYQLKFSEDTGDPDVLAKRSRLKQLQTDIKNELLFFKHWLLDLDDEEVEQCKEAAPDHAYYLQRIRDDKPYTKEEEVEEILNIKGMTSGEAFSNLYQVVTNQYTYRFQGEDVTRQELTKYVRSSDPDKRREAYGALLEQHADESTELTEIYKNVVLDWYNEGVKIRGHEAPISIRNHANHVSDEAVDALLTTVQNNTELFADYFREKAELLGHEHNRYHLYAPYTVDKDYSYEESKRFVLSAFKEFDERFHDAAKQVFDDDHVHSHPKEGKRGGAFNLSVHNEITPYMMLNHTGKLRDVFTMAHELGHAVHGVLSQDQPNLVYKASLPMAETASVFAETVVAKKLLAEGDDDEKTATLLYLLDKLYGTVCRQAYFTIFERKAHDAIQDGVTQHELEEIYLETLTEQFGAMQIPDGFRHEWHAIPHFHHSPFYCYAYSWGNLSVLSMFKQYGQKGNSFVENYLDVLRKGGSAAPVDLLNHLDLAPGTEEFWEQGFGVIEEMKDELDALL